MNQTLSPDDHINTIVVKSLRVLGCIRRYFSHIDEQTFLTLYKSLIRPILEYNSAVWSPNLKKHKEKIETVQRKATKIVPSLMHLPYSERLRHLGLPTLEYRRDREDLIQTFKILSEENNPLSHFFIIERTQRLRGHSKKIKKTEHYKSCLRQNFFSQRVINNWNALSQETVNASSLNTFKTCLNSLNWHENKFVL